jgi:hypothetical protein
MTVRRSGATPDQAFYAAVRPSNSPAAAALSDWDTIKNAGLASLAPALTVASFPLTQDARFASQWAEVTYFLDLNAGQTTAGGSVNMYPLYRRVRVLGHKPFASNLVGAAADRQRLLPLLAVDSVANPTTVYGPAEVAKPANRFGGDGSNWTATSFPGLTPATDGTFPTGADILLTNVISFEVKAVWDGTPAPNTFSSNTDTPYDNLPTAPNTNNSNLATKRVFDTWWQDPNNPDAWRTSGQNGTTDCVPQFIRVREVQIKVRVYDTKTQSTRQITLVQEV